MDSEGHIDSIKKIYLCQAGTKAVTNELRKCRSLSYRTMIGHTRPIHGYLSYKIKSTRIRLTQIISRYYPIRNIISVLACRFKCVFIMSIYLTCIAFKAHFQRQLFQIPTWKKNITYFQLSLTILSFSLPIKTSILFYEPRQESLPYTSLHILLYKLNSGLYHCTGLEVSLINIRRCRRHNRCRYRWAP